MVRGVYVPYFYARQAELRAVVASAARFGNAQEIFPLLEPATDDPREFVRSLHSLKTQQKSAYVVVNPRHGRQGIQSVRQGWQAALAGFLPDPALVRPALLEHSSTTTADVANFLGNYPHRPVGIVLTTNRLDAAALHAALGSANVIVFLLPGVNPVLYNTVIGAARVAVVSDSFPAQARNADYAGVEWMTTDHLVYIAAGQAAFSDFTILPAAFSPTGGRPGAVAFHLTFKEVDKSFWIQHFVSDETDRDVGTPQTKLLEAIAYLEAQIAVAPNRFVTSPAIDDYRRQGATGAATNLSSSKKLQIIHHLYEVSAHLGL
jgi:hypothetical protein